MITITIDSAEVRRAFDAIAPERLRQVIGVAVAEDARAILATYPAASGRPQPFRSAKSRRFFFAALRDGRISVPYRRGGPTSQGLGRRWLIAPDGDGVTLTNSASYAGLVQGMRTEQAKYHTGTWKGVEDVAEQMERDGSAVRAADEAVTGAIVSAGGA